MKLQYLALIGEVILLLGVSCSVGYSSKMISPSNTLSDRTAASFDQKQECQKYQQEVEGRIKTDWNDETRTAWLLKLFYTPKRNSCMYSMQTSLFTTSGTHRESYMLFDTLTNEKIEQSEGCPSEVGCGVSLMQAARDFDKLVTEYE